GVLGRGRDRRRDRDRVPRRRSVARGGRAGAPRRRERDGGDAGALALAHLTSESDPSAREIRHASPRELASAFVFGSRLPPMVTAWPTSVWFGSISARSQYPGFVMT